MSRTLCCTASCCWSRLNGRSSIAASTHPVLSLQASPELSIVDLAAATKARVIVTSVHGRLSLCKVSNWAATMEVADA